MPGAPPVEKSRCVSGVALDLKSSAEEADLGLLVVKRDASCRWWDVLSLYLLLRIDMSVPLQETCLGREAPATETESDGLMMVDRVLLR